MKTTIITYCSCDYMFKEVFSYKSTSKAVNNMTSLVTGIVRKDSAMGFLTNNPGQSDCHGKSISFKMTPEKPHISSCYSHKSSYESPNKIVYQSTSAG